MRCDRIQWLLSAYADGELPPRLAARVADHLRRCEACAAESLSLTRVITALHALPAEEPPAGLRQAVFAAVDTAQPTIWQRARAALLPVTAPGLPAMGALATGLAVLGLVAVPLERAEWHHRPVSRLVYDMPVTPVSTVRPTTTAPVRVAEEPAVKAPEPAVAAPVRAPGPASNLVAQVSPPTRSTPAVKPGALTRSPNRVALAGGATRPTGKATPRRDTAPHSKFDPRVPMPETNGAPVDASAPNIVMADAPLVMPQMDTTVMASMPSSADMSPPPTPESDALAALRERLAHEELRLPPIHLEPQRSHPKRGPILYRGF